MAKLLYILICLFYGVKSAGDSIDEHFMEGFFDVMLKFFYENMELKLLSSKNVTRCTNTLTPIFQKNYTVVGKAFEYSGKGLSDLGNEKECIRLNDSSEDINLTYFQLRYDFNFSKGNNDEDLPVMKFLNQSTYYTGFCMFGACMEILNLVFNNETNYKFAKFLLREAGLMEGKTKIIQLTNWTEYYKTWKTIDESTGEQGTNPKGSDFHYYAFTIYIYFSIAYFFCKIIASGIRIIFLSSGYDKTYTKIMKRKEEDRKREMKAAQKGKDESYSDVLNDSKEASNNIFSVSSTKILDGDFDSNDDDIDYPLKLKMIKILDISDNFGQLSSDKTKIYNDRGLEPLVFYRIIVLLFMVFNHNMYTLTTIPAKDFLNGEFYKRPPFCLIKMSMNAPVCWIVIEGAVCAYKLMNYIKNEMNKKETNYLRITTILKFFCLCIPKIINFCMIYYFIHYLAFYTGKYMDSMSMFDFFITQICQKKDCYKNSWLFKLFLLPYSDFKAIEIPHHHGTEILESQFIRPPFFTNCFKFTNIFVNEFYCFIFILIVVYLSYKFRNKWFDIFWGIALIANSVCAFLVMSPIQYTELYNAEGETEVTDYSHYYTYTHMMGHNYNEKYTHLFINFYLMGFLIGLCYFYYHDAVDKNSMTQDKEKYLPFSFCYSLIKKLDNMERFTITLIRLGLIVILFLLSLSYYFLRMAFNTEDDTELVIDIDRANTLIHFIYYNEKLIFAFFFSLLLLTSLFRDKNGTFNNLMTSKFINPFNRSSFVLFCMCDTVIYISYCLFIFRMSLTYQNLFFLTIGMLIIVSIISFLHTSMYLMPLRLLVKRLIGNKRKKRAESSIKEEMVSRSQSIASSTEQIDIKRNIQKLYEL